MAKLRDFLQRVYVLSPYLLIQEFMQSIAQKDNGSIIELIYVFLSFIAAMQQSTLLQKNRFQPTFISFSSLLAASRS